MSGYVARLDALRDAVGRQYEPLGAGPLTSQIRGPAAFLASDDALLRRVAERLSDELVDDVVALIMLARGKR